MTIKVNTKWIDSFVEEFYRTGEATRTTEHNKVVKAVIMRFDELNIPFKLYKLGAGVTKITTIQNYCPCCKREIK